MTFSRAGPSCRPANSLPAETGFRSAEKSWAFAQFCLAQRSFAQFLPEGQRRGRVSAKRRMVFLTAGMESADGWLVHRRSVPLTICAGLRFQKAFSRWAPGAATEGAKAVGFLVGHSPGTRRGQGTAKFGGLWRLNLDRRQRFQCGLTLSFLLGLNHQALNALSHALSLSFSLQELVVHQTPNALHSFLQMAGKKLVGCC